jgi:hypothetical protein
LRAFQFDDPVDALARGVGDPMWMNASICVHPGRYGRGQAFDLGNAAGDSDAVELEQPLGDPVPVGVGAGQGE